MCTKDRPFIETIFADFVYFDGQKIGVMIPLHFSLPAGASSRPPCSPGVTVVNASTQSDLSLLTGTESSIGNLIASLEKKTNHSLALV